MLLNEPIIAYMSLAEKQVTSPILCSRRKEPPSETMLQVNELLKGLMESRRKG